MALILDEDKQLGLKVNGMYYRIDKINFNDYDFQVVVTGYASEEAFKSGAFPIADPRAYTIGDYGKENIPQVFAFGYEMLKKHPHFQEAEDHFNDGQETVL